jgi:uncharacterized protein YlaI
MDLPIFPLLPDTQQNLLRREYRVGLRVVQRCPFIEAEDIFKYTKEKPLKHYVCKYLQKRLAKARKTDLGHSKFYENVFYWDKFVNQKVDGKGKQERLGIGHLFCLSRVRRMIDRYESYLLKWLNFIDQYNSKNSATTLCQS